MIEIKIKQLEARSKNRPEGYVDDVISMGEKVEGGSVFLSLENYNFLKEKYRGKREEPPQVEEPTRLDMIKNFSSAMANWVKSGYKTVDKSTYLQRLAICESCDLWDPKARAGLGKCNHKKCGCSKMKQWLASEKCPLEKWKAVD